MRKSQKIALALGLGAAALAGGTAFTGTGLATTAPTTQFLGGTVSQSVTGATLSGVDYSFANAPANTEVSSIALTFANTADGHTVAVAPAGGTGSFTCSAVSNNASTCTFDGAADTGYAGLTSLDVTVS
ncbi:hypothetical protein [Sinomonas atrocyanea]|uniref:hypothetical protein n=1 Tax=Sinomonas atrocyanea TaxID=37927 RepID=UPI002788D188|nr:hypothetical protein [Sinomonas atrocyanea]MDQ0259528.1 hypothetical protein [Sinomonas atrocyanea]MDR6623213.1 hypothetical protein [Sinomonas atrocyanea]